MRPAGNPAGSAGFALAAVLWAVVILGLIIAIMLGQARDGASAARQAAARLVERARAEGVTNLVILSLLDRRAEHRPRVDGVVDTMEFDHARFRVAVQDQGGLVDINAADRDVLLKLFEHAGLDRTAADAMADRTLDWRDPGPLKRLNGAKRDDYIAAGLRYGPDGTPFKSADEMRMVMGMTEALYQRIRPAITVFSGAATVNPQTAPLLALEAAGLARQDAEQAIALRDAPVLAAEAGPVAGGRIVASLYPAGWAFAIRVVPEGKPAAVLEAMVRITDDPDHRVWVLGEGAPR